MSSSGRVLRSNGQATSAHKPISAISAPNTLSTLSTLTELSTTTCGESDGGLNTQTPLPLDDEWAANLRRVVFVPSVAQMIAKNTPKSLDTHRQPTRSPSHVMLFPKTKAEALNMGIRLKCHSDASGDAMPPAERRTIPLPKRVNGGTEAMEVDSQAESAESLE